MANKKPFRLIAVLPVAAIVTAAVFLALAGIVESSSEETIWIDDSGMLTECGLDGCSRTTPPPPTEATLASPADLPPAPKQPKPYNKDPRDYIVYDPPFPGPNNPDSPIVRFPPQYPKECAEQKLSGRVDVVFDITADGRVTNARIISSTHNCFNEETIRTIRRWKYRPTGNGGSEIVRRGVTQTFRFQLTE